jgi:hypothetical protein
VESIEIPVVKVPFKSSQMQLSRSIAFWFDSGGQQIWLYRQDIGIQENVLMQLEPCHAKLIKIFEPMSRIAVHMWPRVSPGPPRDPRFFGAYGGAFPHLCYRCQRAGWADVDSIGLYFCNRAAQSTAIQPFATRVLAWRCRREIQFGRLGALLALDSEHCGPGEEFRKTFTMIDS